MRTATTIVILVLIFSAPYWLYIPCIVFGLIAFPYYFEGIAFGFLIDVLYGTHTSMLYLPFTLLIALGMLLCVPIRKLVRLNA